jgi:hypothetical protein
MMASEGVASPFVDTKDVDFTTSRSPASAGKHASTCRLTELAYVDKLRLEAAANSLGTGRKIDA